MGLFSGIRGYFEQRAFRQTPLAQALEGHTQEYLYGRSVMSGFSDEAKERFTVEMTQQLAAAFQSPDPVAAVREQLVSYAINYAQLQVLCLTEEEKTVSFYSANPYISGELWRHIDEGAEFVDELAEYRWSTEAEDIDLLDICNVRAAVSQYFLNAFNIARSHLEDVTEPDWFRPLVEAQLVYEESRIRHDLGLPLTVKDLTEALAYSTMWNMVVNGAANPFYEWCKTWPDKYLAGRGPMLTPPK